MLLARFEVRPLYAQIDLYDPAAMEGPVPETGEELVVATSQWITVHTRGDCAGEVTVEVWQGHLEAEDSGVSGAIFDGRLELTSQTALVGNYVMNVLVPLNLGSGPHRIRVYTSPKGEWPDHIYFVVD